MQQSKINLDIRARLANNDKTLEDINVKMDSFSSAINDQLEYNKNIEAKVAQLAAMLLGICPRGNHRDDDIMIVSITYIMSSVNIHYRQTCID